MAVDSKWPLQRERQPESSEAAMLRNRKASSMNVSDRLRGAESLQKAFWWLLKTQRKEEQRLLVKRLLH